MPNNRKRTPGRRFEMVELKEYTKTKTGKKKLKRTYMQKVEYVKLPISG